MQQPPISANWRMNVLTHLEQDYLKLIRLADTMKSLAKELQRQFSANRHLIDLSVIGFEERERGCPVGPVRSAAAACGRRRFRLTSSCRSEFAEKTEVEEMRERREAAAVACNVGGRHRNPPLLSVPHYLKLKFHYPPSHALHRFTAFPMYHPGGLKFPIRAISEATVDPLTPKKEDEEQSPQNWTIKMLYDGDCPLCMREVNMLRERNKDSGTIKFVDINSNEYSPEENQGLDYKTVMGRIHAILSVEL
nr:uncharacterized protein, mitochondrial [Quercus suber]